jgi:ABC-type transport system involved in multi-copper enzyme maturation permease subunit
MTWLTWRQYRFQGALAAALLAVLAVLLLFTGLHAAWVWHSAMGDCAKNGSCASLAGSNLSLGSPTVAAVVVATSAVPLLPGLFWGAPMVASELETGTNQFAWTQSITRRRWLAVRAGWLLLAAAILAGAVSAIVTWWSGPYSALTAEAFQVNRFDVTDIVPVGYAIFAMALGICAGALLRRTLPALAVTLAGFVALRALIALWLRPRYMTPATVYFKLTAPFTPAGSYLSVGQGVVGANGMPPVASTGSVGVDGVPVPAACQQFIGTTKGNFQPVLSCMAAHGYRGYVSYQPASRFWAFQGVETGIFVVLAAALIGVTFWVLKRRDA